MSRMTRLVDAGLLLARRTVTVFAILSVSLLVAVVLAAVWINILDWAFHQ